MDGLHLAEGSDYFKLRRVCSGYSHSIAMPTRYLSRATVHCCGLQLVHSRQAEFDLDFLGCTWPR